MIDTIRHKSIFNAATFRMPVHVIGCGGMGSRLAEGLIRMGVAGNGEEYPLHLYDFDVYEPHNVSNQFVDREGAGYAKVGYLRQQLFLINPEASIVDHTKKVEEDIGLSGVVFICVDTMIDRKVIMEFAVEDNLDVKCVIETRMDAYVGISHCFNPGNRRQCDCWWLYWHTDDEAEDIAGCNGVQSIISSIFGTTMLALKHFESFARSGSTNVLPNRIYQDFDAGKISSEFWPAT